MTGSQQCQADGVTYSACQCPYVAGSSGSGVSGAGGAAGSLVTGGVGGAAGSLVSGGAGGVSGSSGVGGGAAGSSGIGASGVGGNGGAGGMVLNQRPKCPDGFKCEQNAFMDAVMPGMQFCTDPAAYQGGGLVGPTPPLCATAADCTAMGLPANTQCMSAMGFMGCIALCTP